MLSKQNLIDFLEFSTKLVKEAGKILLKEQKKVRIVKYKDRKDIVTSTDLASEKFVINEITRNFPDHSILSEEKGEINKLSDFRWIIDPLDGTKEYIRGIPLWNFSMALEYKNELLVSVVYRPFEESLFSAAKGTGSFLNGKSIKVSSIQKLEDSFIFCYLPLYHRNRENYENAYKRLSEIGKKTYRLRSLSDENTGLCWLAQGGIEAYVNLSNPPKWHDFAPGLFVAQEAGALITDSRGKSLNRNFFNGIIASNNHRILDRIIDIVS